MACLILGGSWFHNSGALAAKALSPSVTILVLGRTSRALSADLSLREGKWGDKRSEIYPGASPFSDLKTNKLTLKSILNMTGSQCSEARIGVIWSYLLVFVRTLAAVFCTS